tara:strand:+ start:552 stop:1037 length:486 start_codon:yes stop_codon:yes gene_type:complete
MAINFPEGVQDAPFDANVAYDFGPITAISNSQSFNNIGLETADITIKDANSLFFYWCELGTEIDGSGTGHGVARVLYSTDSGSNFTPHHYYNITGANDNSVGNGFRGYFDHDLSAGTSIRFKVQYAKNGTSGSNHTVADTGPQGSFGGNPVTRFFAFEVNQ